MKRLSILSLFLLLISYLGICQSLNIAPNHTQVKPVKQGKKVPIEGELKDIEGKAINFSDLIKGKNQETLVIFYRGGWCPFCNRHLADLQDIVEPLKKKDVKIIAISPDSQKRMENMVEKHSLSYELYSDFSHQIISNFGVGFYQSKTVMPVPAVYLINEKGKVKFAYYNVDYTKRLSNKKILQAVEEN